MTVKLKGKEKVSQANREKKFISGTETNAMEKEKGFKLIRNTKDRAREA